MSEDQGNGKVTADWRGALRAAAQQVSGVSVLDRGKFDIVKYGKTTLGYLNGTRSVRVDFPMRSGTRNTMHIASDADVALAVAEMETFIPPLEREAKPDPKPSRKTKEKATA